MDSLESQNDDMIEGLFQKVGMLKNVNPPTRQTSLPRETVADDLGDGENRGGNSRFVRVDGYYGTTCWRGGDVDC